MASEWEVYKLTAKLQADTDQYLAKLKAAEVETIRAHSSMEKALKDDAGAWGLLGAGAKDTLKDIGKELITLGGVGSGTAAKIKESWRENFRDISRMASETVKEVNSILSNIGKEDKVFSSGVHRGFVSTSPSSVSAFKDEALKLLIAGDKDKGSIFTPGKNYQIAAREIFGLLDDLEKKDKLKKKTSRIGRIGSILSDLDYHQEDVEDVEEQINRFGMDKHQRDRRDHKQKLQKELEKIGMAPGTDFEAAVKSEREKAVKTEDKDRPAEFRAMEQALDQLERLDQRITELKGKEASRLAGISQTDAMMKTEALMKAADEHMEDMQAHSKRLELSMNNVAKDTAEFARNLARSNPQDKPGSLSPEEQKKYVDRERENLQTQHNIQLGNERNPLRNRTDSSLQAGNELHENKLKAIALQTQELVEHWTDVDKAVAEYGVQLKEAHKYTDEEINKQKKDLKDQLDPQHEARRTEAAKRLNQSYDSANEEKHAEALKSAAKSTRDINDQIDSLKNHWSSVDTEVKKYKNSLEDAYAFNKKEIDDAVSKRKSQLSDLAGANLTRANRKPEEKFKEDADDLAKLRVTLGPDFEETYQRESRKQQKEFLDASGHYSPDQAIAGGRHSHTAAVNEFAGRRRNADLENARRIANEAREKAELPGFGERPRGGESSGTGSFLPEGGVSSGTGGFPPDQQKDLLTKMVDYLRQLVEGDSNTVELEPAGLDT